MYTGNNLGNKCPMNKVSRVAHPECNEGKAPNTTGEAWNAEVNMSIPKSLSMAFNPAASPAIE
jgi:hypothetical protein